MRRIQTPPAKHRRRLSGPDPESTHGPRPTLLGAAPRHPHAAPPRLRRTTPQTSRRSRTPLHRRRHAPQADPHPRLHRLLRLHPPRHPRRQALPPRPAAPPQLQIHPHRIPRPRLIHPSQRHPHPASPRPDPPRQARRYSQLRPHQIARLRTGTGASTSASPIFSELPSQSERQPATSSVSRSSTTGPPATSSRGSTSRSAPSSPKTSPQPSPPG